MHAKLLFLHALSPLHAGTGQGVGVIDLPIAREKATDIPIVPGTSVKGVLRDACPDGQDKIAVFGPETDNADDHAGSAQFTDMRLLLLPVRSLKGTFAWVTSPLLLRRLQRDANHAENATLHTSIPSPANLETCLVSSQNCAIAMTRGNASQVIVEDLVLAAQGDADAFTWADMLAEYLFPGDNDWQDALRARFCVVHDDTLAFLLQTATEVTARIRLEKNKKTVAQGALWYEEALPAETIMVGLLIAAEVKADKSKVFTSIGNLIQAPLQIGGSATVGRGLCQMRLV